MAVSRFIDSADQYYMRQMVEEEVRRREQQLRIEYEANLQKSKDLWWTLSDSIVRPGVIPAAATNPDERLLILLTEE